MQISHGQLQALEDAQRTGFARELVTHLRSLAPEHFQSVDDGAVMAVAVDGIGKASAHGFACRASARFFVECMVMFGSDFVDDPQYAVLVSAMGTPGDANALARADRLHAAVTAWTGRVGGVDGHGEARAFRRAAALSFDQWRAFSTRSHDTVALLAHLHPDKAACAGPQALHEIVRAAFALAERQGGGWVEGAALYAGLMFLFGWGCLADRQFPWIGAAFAGKPPVDAALALPTLQRHFVRYVEHSTPELLPD